MHMLEFLIRTQDDHECPPIDHDRMSQVLTPAGWGCQRIAGWGNYRLRCGDTEISFSDEDVGWQVAFEGPMPSELARRLIATIAAQIEHAVHEPIDWIQITF